jgi:hypothetical protein
MKHYAMIALVVVVVLAVVFRVSAIKNIVIGA